MNLNLFQKSITTFQQILIKKKNRIKPSSEAILLLRVEPDEFKAGKSAVMLRTEDKLAVLGARVVATFPITPAGFRMGHLKHTVLKILESPDIRNGAILVVNNVEDFHEKAGEFLSKIIDEKFVLRSIDDVFFDAGREEYERQ